jgi:hypothetical protein
VTLAACDDADRGGAGETLLRPSHLA